MYVIIIALNVKDRIFVTSSLVSSGPGAASLGRPALLGRSGLHQGVAVGAVHAETARFRPQFLHDHGPQLQRRTELHAQPLGQVIVGQQCQS